MPQTENTSDKNILRHDCTYKDDSKKKDTETIEGKNIKKKKRTFSLYKFKGDRCPKSGGSYSGTPLQAALKCANRWIVPKDDFKTVFTFQLIETGKNTENSNIYEFNVKRVKLEKPKYYKRGNKEITVVSKIVSV